MIINSIPLKVIDYERPILYKFERFLNWWDEISENNIEYFMELGLDLRQKEAFDEFHQFVYELIKAKENQDA